MVGYIGIVPNNKYERASMSNFSGTKIVAVTLAEYILFGCTGCGYNPMVMKVNRDIPGTRLVECVACGGFTCILTDGNTRSAIGFKDRHGELYLPAIQKHPKSNGSNVLIAQEYAKSLSKSDIEVDDERAAREFLKNVCSIIDFKKRQQDQNKSE